MNSDKEFVIGVDVGTLSARAGIFDLKGTLVGMGIQPISIYHPQTDFVEQSSEDIWEKTGLAIREAIKQAQIEFPNSQLVASLIRQDLPRTYCLCCQIKRIRL